MRKLVAAGRRDREIALALAISAQRVRVHMKNIFTKLDVSGRTEATNLAIRRGVCDLSSGSPSSPAGA